MSRIIRFGKDDPKRGHTKKYRAENRPHMHIIRWIALLTVKYRFSNNHVIRKILEHQSHNKSFYSPYVLILRINVKKVKRHGVAWSKVIQSITQKILKHLESHNLFSQFAKRLTKTIRS